MITKIRITQEDISYDSHGCTTCPAALAINRVLQPCYEALVSPDAVRIRLCGHFMVDEKFDIELPEALASWIWRYDHNRDESPAVFELDIPEKYLEAA